MALAYLTGAVASGVAAAGLVALMVWVATVVTGSSDAWSVARWLVTVVAAVVAIATYVAEGIAQRRTLARMRSTGEPWAHREEG